MMGLEHLVVGLPRFGLGQGLGILLGLELGAVGGKRFSIDHYSISKDRYQCDQYSISSQVTEDVAK